MRVPNAAEHQKRENYFGRLEVTHEKEAEDFPPRV